MKIILVSMMIALMLFVSCNSSTPAPDEKPGTNPPSTVTEGSLVEKTTTGKFVVESTINSLSAKIQHALQTGEAVTLDGEKLSNGVTVTTGTISVTSATEETRAGRSARATDANYQIVIDIKEATDEENKPVTLEYTSNVTVDETTKTITSIEPVSTVATIDDAEVTDIDSETFVPVALAFSDTGLLENLGKVMTEVADYFNAGSGITMKEITLTVESVGDVTVDCEKTSLSPVGSGVLAFKIETIDNQWHTMSNLGGQITIDGWADVTEEGITESEKPLIKDDENRTLEDTYVSGDLAPRLYMLLMMSHETLLYELDTIPEVITATPDQIEELNIYAEAFFGDNVTVNSYELSFNELWGTGGETYKTPGTMTMKADLSNLGPIEMTVSAYDTESNDISASAITTIKIDDEDYSYLSLDMLKSMFRVYAAFQYEAAIITDVIANPKLQTTPEGGTLTHTLSSDEYLPSFSGSVTIKVNELSETRVEAGYDFDNVKVHDIGDVIYTISGNGTFSLSYAGQNMNITSFSIVGMGNATESELQTVKAYINLMNAYTGEQQPSESEFTYDERAAVSQAVMNLISSNITDTTKITAVDDKIVVLEDISNNAYTMMKGSEASMATDGQTSLNISINANLRSYDGIEYLVTGSAKISIDVENPAATTVTSNNLQIVKFTANGQEIPEYVENEIVLSLISSFAGLMNNI